MVILDKTLNLDGCVTTDDVMAVIKREYLLRLIEHPGHSGSQFLTIQQAISVSGLSLTTLTLTFLLCKDSDSLKLPDTG